jgi:hypothetical protein
MKPSASNTAYSLEEGAWLMQQNRAAGKGWRARLLARCSCALRPCATAILGVLLVKLLVLGLVAAWPVLHRAAQNGFRALYYGVDPMMFGRSVQGSHACLQAYFVAALAVEGRGRPYG